MSQGSVEEFKANWQRPEAEYCHFTRGEPENQIQFAFRQNWLEFQNILNGKFTRDGKTKVLEVGSGRGTMSMHFAANGFNSTILDAEKSVLEEAVRQFHSHGLSTTPVVSNVEAIDRKDGQYSVVFSYGLMEHFSDVRAMMAEQCRVLKSGGVLIAYVVDGSPNQNIELSSLYDRAVEFYGHGKSNPKSPVFRNGFDDGYYLASMRQAGLSHIGLEWVYGLPMISPQTEFPFTLNPPELEKELTAMMAELVRRRGWRVDKRQGQAFIVWGWKR